MISPSPIFRFAIRMITPILLLFSLVIFWRGHQLPGGGFVGGLVAASALIVYALCWGTVETVKMMRMRPQSVLFLGLLAALSGALLASMLDDTFFKGIWIDIPIVGKVGSPMLFDFGVYLIVIGSVCTSLFALMEEEK